MLQNVGVNTEIKKKTGLSARTPSLKLKERCVKHTRINNIKDLNEIYIYGEMLGRGVFGTVVEITDKNSKKIWALKIVDKRTTKGTKINTIDNEIRILRMVNHPHIVFLDQTFESSKHIYLVIERCTTELAHILRQKKKFTETEARKVMDHLSSAVAYLHKYEIVHRDLKMENILTAPNPDDPADELYIKVSDFGLGIIKSGNRPDQMLSDRCGTLIYMAPEIISRASYSQQCDVWAMGVICYLLLTGDYPFYSKNENNLVDSICNYEPDYSKFPGGTEVIHLITKMLDKNPALRISAAEVCRHPWIRGDTIDGNTHNVLDMMQLWRAEMMVEPMTDNTSDWERAFSSLRHSMDSSQNLDILVSKNLQKNSSVSRSESKQLFNKNVDQNAVKSVNIKVDKKIPPRNKVPQRPKTPVLLKVEEHEVTLTPQETRNAINDRILNIKGRNTKLIRIGKCLREKQPRLFSFEVERL